MLSHVFRVFGTAALLVAASGAAYADVCVTIDQARDSLTADERVATIILVTKEFALEGQRVVPDGCATPYVLTHARLGDLIVVSLAGPNDRREALARGTDDLPALYSQMVRSIVTGRPMTGLNVVDRTNVTASQASARRIYSDSIWYGRLGYSALFTGDRHGVPSVGFGYRAEFDRFGIDLAFLNFQMPGSGYQSSDASVWSWLKLSGLYFLSPIANRTAYLGAGLSYGGQHFGRTRPSVNSYTSGWRGRGLQSELTAGYEVARVTSLRLFVQADAVLPFYHATSDTILYATPYVPRQEPTITFERRYAPSLSVSIALGR
jgi:hypothetical protein